MLYISGYDNDISFEGTQSIQVFQVMADALFGVGNTYNKYVWSSNSYFGILKKVFSLVPNIVTK